MTEKISNEIQKAGLAGAGGAGFPTYAKWERLDDVDNLLVNHQESEPNFYKDKWLIKENPKQFKSLCDRLLSTREINLIIFGIKEKDRNEWMGPLEEETAGSVYTKKDLPIDPEKESGVVFGYTRDSYGFGIETVLLGRVADVNMSKDELPMDYGWIVNNSETCYNIHKALEYDKPVTHKYLHVDGETPESKLFRAPIGTPPKKLLREVGIEISDVEEYLEDEELILVEGGPGWCFEIEEPVNFGVKKKTNGIMVIDDIYSSEERIDVREEYEWKIDEKQSPRSINPEHVQIPLITNLRYENLVKLSEPVVEKGERVGKGEIIAEPAKEGISNYQHASIDGRIKNVENYRIEIQVI